MKLLNNLTKAIFGGSIITLCLFMFTGVSLLIFKETSYPALYNQICWFIIICISSLGIGLKFVGCFDE